MYFLSYFFNNNEKKGRKMNPIIAGSIAGGSGYIGTLPLDFIKQRLQTTKDLKASQKLIIQSVKDKGLKILFKGGAIGSASIMPQMAIKFSTNDYLSRKTKYNYFQNGFIAGYLDGSFLGPVLAVQSILQMEVLSNKKLGASNTTNMNYSEALNVLKKVPMFGLTFPMAMRNATYTSVIFGGQRTLEHKYEQTFVNNFLISSALNIPGVIACSPFDVIRAKQIQHILEKKPNNPLLVAKDIYVTNGLRGFYQGFGSLYINFAIRFPVTFSIYFLLMKQK